jgi:hypothetical protein
MYEVIIGDDADEEMLPSLKNYVLRLWFYERTFQMIYVALFICSLTHSLTSQWTMLAGSGLLPHKFHRFIDDGYANVNK